MKQKLIYLSSPFTNGNRKLNALSHLAMFETLSKKFPNCKFYAPLVFAYFGFDRKDSFWHNEKFWMDHDIEMLKRCDAVFVFDSAVPALNYYRESWKNSIGCKREIGEALIHKIPVFDETEIETFYKFLELR